MQKLFDHGLSWLGLPNSTSLVVLNLPAYARHALTLPEPLLPSQTIRKYNMDTEHALL